MTLQHQVCMNTGTPALRLPVIRSIYNSLQLHFVPLQSIPFTISLFTNRPMYIASQIFAIDIHLRIIT